VSLIRALKRDNRKHPLKIIQIRKGDFWNFQAASKQLNYTVVPYTKVKEITYKKSEETTLVYKNSFDEYCKEERVQIRYPKLTRSTKNTSIILPTHHRPNATHTVTAKKERDIRAMLKHMLVVDKQFYLIIFH